MITYVGPREPGGDGDRHHREGARAGLHRAAHAPVVPVLADARCSRSRCPTGRRRSSTTTCSSSCRTAWTGCARSSTQMRAAPAHIRWVARISPAVGVPGRGRRASPSTTIAPMLRVAGGGRVRRDHELDVGRARRAAGGGRDRGRQGGAAARRGPQRGRLLQPAQRALAGRDLRPTTRRSRPRRRWTGCGSGCGRCCASPRCGPTCRRCSTGCATVIDSARRLMFTTDGATPSFYAEHGVIGGALRIATERGVEPMRALQMATIDPATFLGLDERAGRDRARPRGDVQRAAGGRGVAAGDGVRAGRGGRARRAARRRAAASDVARGPGPRRARRRAVRAADRHACRSRATSRR